jgi:hypothetical protein
MTNEQRIEVIAAIDELQQYLNGYVTKTSIQITLDELINKL